MGKHKKTNEITFIALHSTCHPRVSSSHPLLVTHPSAYTTNTPITFLCQLSSFSLQIIHSTFSISSTLINPHHDEHPNKHTISCYFPLIFFLLLHPLFYIPLFLNFFSSFLYPSLHLSFLSFFFLSLIHRPYLLSFLSPS